MLEVLKIKLTGENGDEEAQGSVATRQTHRERKFATICKLGTGVTNNTMINFKPIPS